MASYGQPGALSRKTVSSAMMRSLPGKPPMGSFQPRNAVVQGAGRLPVQPGQMNPELLRRAAARRLGGM